MGSEDADSVKAGGSAASGGRDHPENQGACGSAECLSQPGAVADGEFGEESEAGGAASEAAPPRPATDVSAAPAPAAESPPSGEGRPAGPGEIESSADQLRLQAEALCRLETRLATGFAEIERRDATLDRLHLELQEHRGDLLIRAMEPTLRGLLRLHDAMGDLLDRASGNGPVPEAKDLLHQIEVFREEIAETLYRQGAEPIEDPPGTPFNGKRHEIVQVVAAAEPEQDRTIVQLHRRGFVIGPRLLRGQRVSVARYTPLRDVPPTDPDGDAPEQTAPSPGRRSEKEGA
jgi:molecular chaperone GrpE (heat shock protein)